MVSGARRLAWLGAGVVSCASPAPDAPPARRTVTFLHTADLHSRLFPDEIVVSVPDAARGLGAAGEVVSVGGAARLATVLGRERDLADAAVVLDAGDVFEGSAVYPTFGGVPELRVLTALGVDAQALGNHDTEMGAPELAALRGEWVRFPLVAANLERQYPGLVEPVALLERGGLTLAIVGAGRSPEGAPAVGETAEAIREVVSAVRPRADVVVLLSHLGTDLDRAIVARTHGIDVVLGGHSHDVVFPPVVVDDCGADAEGEDCVPRGVPILHVGAYGRYVGRVDLVVSSDARDRAGAPTDAPSAIVETSFRLLPVSHGVDEDPGMAAMLAPYREHLDRAGWNEAVAFAPVPVPRFGRSGGDSALGNLMARALGEGTGADLSVVPASALRADLPAGEVTPEDLARAMPFDDRPVAIELTGVELDAAFREVARASCERDRTPQVHVEGATVAFSCSPVGARLEVRGKALVPGARYRVVTTSFLVEQGRWFAGKPVLGEGFETLSTRLTRLLAGRPSCPDGPPALPCIDASLGAVADGRVRWQ